MKDQLSLLYEVGGHAFCVRVPSGMQPIIDLRGSYPAFRSERKDGDTLFTLQIDDAPLFECQGDYCSLDSDGSMMRIRQEDTFLSVMMGVDTQTPCATLLISPDFRTGWLRVSGSEYERFYGIDNAIMMMYSFASAGLSTLLIHASVIENSRDGFAFLGKSGTGKSTHAALWQKAVAGSRLLNDDNPVIRIIGGQAYIYGTPWSGKTPCYVNRRARLRAVTRLWQAGVNSVSRLEPLLAYSALLPACSCMKWDRMMALSVHQTISELISVIPFFRMDCLPDENAVRLCAATIINCPTPSLMASEAIAL